MTAALSISDLSTFKAFAHQLADAAGQVILPYFRRAMSIDNKHAGGGFDPVTEADRRAEEVIREMIGRHFPDHGVMGEEYGFQAGRSALTWVIDPIDGTRAFMCGMAQWGTLIALNDGTRPVLGVLDQPYTEERWSGGGGVAEFARRGGQAQALQSRRGVRLGQATLSTTSPVGYFDDIEQRAFWALSNETRLTRFGGDCYAYGLLANGFIDIVVESGLQAWDVQALIPIVEDAGGVMTNWEGRGCTQGGQVVACGDPALLPQVLQVLADAR
jgi:myo-inositol-1(or 4)-monophosphatase